MIKEFVFDDCDGFEQCHAATLAYGNGTDIIAAWFAGTSEGNEDVAIWLSVKSSGRWSIPAKIAKVNKEPHWNPVLFNPGNGVVYLYFKIGKTIPGWITWVMSSSDGGSTWSEPVELAPGDASGGRGPVKNKPVVLTNGDWLAPGSVETKTEWSAFCDLSSDKGETWSRSDLIHLSGGDDMGKGVIQPTVWESERGKIHMLLRSTCGKICRSDSDDGGHTWTPALPTDLPNNNSGLDLTRLSDGRLVLIHNPTDDRRKRAPLSLSISEDDGATWRKVVDVETEPENFDGPVENPFFKTAEFSYPSIISSDSTVSAVYTVHRKKIAFIQRDM
jgi:predicted neuraminidase